MLYEVITSVAMLSVIKQSVVILKVVAPQRLKSEINLSARERERVREFMSKEMIRMRNRQALFFCFTPKKSKTDLTKS